MSAKHHTAIEIADARIALLHTIGHLQALAAMAQTATQRDTALRLAARLTSVLPLVDDHTPSNCPSVDSQGKKGEPAAPGTGGSGLPCDPNYCQKCVGLGYCRCEIACNH